MKSREEKTRQNKFLIQMLPNAFERTDFFGNPEFLVAVYSDVSCHSDRIFTRPTPLTPTKTGTIIFRLR
jgi:hypothetical protein